MIPKNLRVPREKIAFILKKGESIDSKLFIARYIENNQNNSRYRTIVSTKIEKKAVKRNRLRRHIYEAVRLKEKEKTKKGQKLDIILIPKKQILKADFQEIKDDLLTLI